MSLHERVATFETGPPEWEGPPMRMLPGVAPTEQLLADTGAITIALGPMLVYPTGVTITLEISDPQAEVAASIAREWLREVDGGFRLDVSYSDGPSVPVGPPSDRRPDPEKPTLVMRGAEGLGRAQTVEYWLWPLPPAEPLTLSVAWPRRGIAASATRIDGALMRRASTRSRRF
jgi:hypothetical protein